MSQFNPARNWTGDGWLYTNTLEQSLMVKVALTWGFNLPDFDTWLIDLESCAAKDGMMKYREEMLHESTAMLKRSIESLKQSRFMIERENFLLPLAKGEVSNLAKKYGAAGGVQKFSALKTEVIRLANPYTDKTPNEIARLIYLDVRRFADDKKLKKLSEKEELTTIARWIKTAPKPT